MGNLHRPELGSSFLLMRYLTRFVFIRAWLFLCLANIQATETKPHIVMLSGDGVDGSPSRPGHIEEMANRLLQHSVEVHNLLFASSQNSFQFRPYGLGTTGIQGRLGDVLARNTRGSFEF